MARHIEQPGSRHSAPASRKIRSSPSASAAFFTAWEPATTSVRVFTLRPRITLAASRRSSSRPFVQLPTKTTSTFWPRMGLPGVERHVAERALERRARRGILLGAGIGTRPVTGIPCAGLVPNVTIGSSRETSIVTSRS